MGRWLRIQYEGAICHLMSRAIGAIKPMDQASEAVFALKPVVFRYKTEIDPAGTSQFALVAEDVEKLNPDLGVRDKQGKPYGVHYDQVTRCCSTRSLKDLAKTRTKSDHDTPAKLN